MGTGLMPEMVRQFRWEQTPLGAIEHWSPTLVASVNQMLFSPTPAILAWGDALVMLYNEAAIAALQGMHPQALGAPYREVYKEVWHLVGPDMEACFYRGATVVRENMLIPLSRNGVPEDCWFTYYLIPVFEDGRVAGIYDPYQNNTEKVRAQQELHDTQRQLQQVLDATTDAVFSLDRQWTFTYLNSNARRLLSPYGELIGRNLWETFPDAQYEGSPFVLEYTRSMEQGVAGEFETYYPKPEGWFQVLSRPAPDGITVFFRDITASKKSADALIESEKLAAVGRLASSIAHEINNPLEAVTNLIYLATISDSFEETRGLLVSADRELQRVAQIASQTLRFHKQATKPTANVPADLLGGVVAIYQGRVAEAGIAVAWRQRESRTILCFEGEVRQVLSNLVGNAIDAMGGDGEGHLHLRAREGHDWRTGRKGVVFTVADSGLGMSAGTLARIFEAFYTTKGLTGTGLGLWVSQEIVHRHAGRLRVRSSQRRAGGVASGTVFTLFLPFEAVSRS
ncbi:PAS domain S-box protein [Acidipila sp. EB88]|nr:PAS domain S-box protein [Acidipila sp. EB88]